MSRYTRLEMLLREYMYRVQFRTENDKIVCHNRLRENSDNIDYVEAIECNVRCQTIDEIFRDLHRILEIARPPTKTPK